MRMNTSKDMCVGHAHAHTLGHMLHTVGRVLGRCGSIYEYRHVRTRARGMPSAMADIGRYGADEVDRRHRRDRLEALKRMQREQRVVVPCPKHIGIADGYIDMVGRVLGRVGELSSRRSC